MTICSTVASCDSTQGPGAAYVYAPTTHRNRSTNGGLSQVHQAQVILPRILKHLGHSAI